MQIADEHLWATGPDLALDEFDVGDSRTAIGVRGVLDIVQCAHSRDRNLGRSVDATDRSLLEIGCGVTDQ